MPDFVKPRAFRRPTDGAGTCLPSIDSCPGGCILPPSHSRIRLFWSAPARWQSGYAAACKAVDAGSIPTLASKLQGPPNGGPLRLERGGIVAEGGSFQFRGSPGSSQRLFSAVATPHGIPLERSVCSVLRRGSVRLTAGRERPLPSLRSGCCASLAGFAGRSDRLF